MVSARWSAAVLSFRWHAAVVLDRKCDEAVERMMPDYVASHNHGFSPGSEEYQAHLAGELQHYSAKFRQGVGRETLFEPVPPIWVM
jgi:hypothetical protein